MTFVKPKNVTYTEMCIYIDDNVYTGNFDENLVFEYLYHICEMLAFKSKYFNSAQYYDNFALYAATEIYLRLTDKRRFTGELERIRSILNYIHSVIYPLKVDFEQSEYAQTVQRAEEVEEDYLDRYSLKLQLQDYVTEINKVDFGLYIENIPATIKAYLKKSLFITNKEEWHNIYISCLLTFLNMITLQPSAEKKLIAQENYVYNMPDVTDKVYKENSNNSVILWNLDSSMKDYIQVLVNKIKHIIVKELSEITSLEISTDWAIEELRFLNIEDEDFET